MTAAGDVDELQAYDSALAEGRLLLRQCPRCSQRHHYPRSYCPFCGSGDMTWTAASGDGEIYSHTMWRQKDDETTLLFVTLAEGPVVLGLKAPGHDAPLAIGDKVRVVAARAGRSLPVFARAERD